MFGDIFDEMFNGGRGGGRGGRGDMRGQDLRFNLEITLEQAYGGTEATVRVPSSVACEVCHGSGAEAGSKPHQCPTCKGHGRLRAQQGFFTVERACHTCHGAGQVIDKPCKSCAGQGRVRREKTLKVNIPAGVEDGTRIRLTGEGEAGTRGGPAGDLYVFLSVRRHQMFEREGADVHCRVPISMVQATLGGNIEVPTLDGKAARINIPAGAQNGHQFRLRAKGMPIVRSTQRGDMYIEINVETPTNLTAKQKELLKEFEKAGKTSPEADGFFSKVKEMFGGTEPCRSCSSGPRASRSLMSHERAGRSRPEAILLLVVEAADLLQTFDPGFAVLLDHRARLHAAVLRERRGEALGMGDQPDLRSLGSLGDQPGERLEQVGMQAALRLVQRDERPAAGATATPRPARDSASVPSDSSCASKTRLRMVGEDHAERAASRRAAAPTSARPGKASSIARSRSTVSRRIWIRVASTAARLDAVRRHGRRRDRKAGPAQRRAASVRRS